MEIVTYNAEQLQRFIESEQFKRLKTLPISRLRAISHINNPRVDPNRDILYVAYDGQEVAGYRLLLCDTIYLEGRPESIGWFSCVWVNPNRRGQGIAKQMVTRVLKDWREEIVMSDPVPASEALYLGTGAFAGPVTLQGIRLYVRSTLAELVLNKKPGLAWMKPLLNVADTVLNTGSYFKRECARNDMNRWLNFKVVEAVDDEMGAFIASFQQQELFRRNKDDLNWITQYPWIRSGEPNEEDRKYYFSSVARRMDYKHMRINNESGDIIGYMLVEIRDNHLKLPYSYFEPAVTQVVANVLWQIILAEGIDTATFFNPLLVAHFGRQHQPAIFAKEIKRNYYVAHRYLPYFKTDKSLNFMEGDGDQAFT